MTLDPEEAAWIERLDAGRQSAAFYDAWVAKEALVKTTGAGITRGLQHLTVLPRESTRVTLRKQIPADMREVAAHWLAAPDSYAACVAWSVTAFGNRTQTLRAKRWRARTSKPSASRTHALV